jgi:hypothetical protein
MNKEKVLKKEKKPSKIHRKKKMIMMSMVIK